MRIASHAETGDKAMPLRDEHQIVSVDDHLVEHPRVWQDRVPARMREAAPRIVEVDGKHQWSYDGMMYPTIGLNAVAGKDRVQRPDQPEHRRVAGAGDIRGRAVV